MALTAAPACAEKGGGVDRAPWPGTPPLHKRVNRQDSQKKISTRTKPTALGGALHPKIQKRCFWNYEGVGHKGVRNNHHSSLAYGIGGQNSLYPSGTS